MRFDDNYGNSYDLYFKTAKYVNGTTCVQAFCEDGEPYGRVSVNLLESVTCSEYEFYADTNNSLDLVRAMLDEDYIAITDEDDVAVSGFCTYPKVVLTPKFLAQYI